MPADKVIELSVEESNKLRAELGLKPLRTAAHDGDTTGAAPQGATHAGAANGGGGGTTGGASAAAGTEDEAVVLNLGVEETNALRATLGLKPLSSNRKATSSMPRHAPAANMGDTKAAAERIERAKLKRQVDDGIQSKFAAESLGTETKVKAKSWAQQIRSNGISSSSSSKKETKKKTNKQQQTSGAYEETDLHGLTVGHSMAELESGSTTVLTLADAPLLNEENAALNDDDVQLENAQLTENKKQQDGLRQKRIVELGAGRAGGYAGFDDDEFEELGGTQAPSQLARSSTLQGPGGGGGVDSKSNTKNTKQRRGFTIGAMLEEQDEQLESDLFSNKAISLVPAQADVAASDFMTVEEDQATTSKKKKSKKFKKEKKKKKKSHRRKEIESDDEEETTAAVDVPKKGLLDELEESAVGNTVKKRRRTDSDDEDHIDTDVAMKEQAVEEKQSKRSKYDQVMAKGNERARKAFDTGNKRKSVDYGPDEEADDAFLNAALAKARRLARLKAQASVKKSGADAVVAAVQQTQSTAAVAAVPSNTSAATTTTTDKTGTITFAVDETREFTRALRARTEQRERKVQQPAKVKIDPDAMDVDDEKQPPTVTSVKEEVPQDDDDDDDDVDINELAKQVKEDDNDINLDGATGQTVHIGRGVGNIMALLKQTGDMTRKNAGKEEMRGRAKDERTYEDYEALDLKKVVRIDERTATAKDKEFANREIKLEYRDKHGRALTRKQAFRELSYQFHGYGQGKRKEDKQLEQIAAEQAEARVASRATAEGRLAGTFGALKATQKATGKSFIVHKTGN